MEGKQRFLQLLAFTTGPAVDVVQHFFEVKIIHQGTDFEDYLNDPQNKHKLFHERYPKIPCCECIQTTYIAEPSKWGCLVYNQFSQLYDENGIVKAGHQKKRGNRILQDCICKVSAQRSIKITGVDLTLLNAIIQKCCSASITTQVSRWMMDIKEVRNKFSHWGDGQVDKDLFDQTWKQLKTATLQCAGDIGHTSVKMFQMAIDQITTCSMDDLGDRISQTTGKLSEVCKDLNGVIPMVKQVCEHVNTQKNDLSVVKSEVEQAKDIIEKVKSKSEQECVELREDMGNMKHNIKQIEVLIAIALQRPGENPLEFDKGEKKRKLNLDVDATCASWDEEKTTRSLVDEVQKVKNCKNTNDNDGNIGFQLEKVENKCIHLELSASQDVFESSNNLRTAIKSLICQFVKAGKLDENVPATLNINIVVKSELTSEEKNVVRSVFRDNNTLDEKSYDEKLPIFVGPPTVEPDKQIASTSFSDILYSRHKIRTLADVDVKTERHEDAIELMSVHLENVKFNFQIRGIPRSLLELSGMEPAMNVKESTNFAVIWTWHYTQKQHPWDVILETINRRMSNLSDWFCVDCAYCDKSSRLVLQTTTASHTFSSLPSLELAVKSFLGKFIEICEFKKYLGEEQLINIDVKSLLHNFKDKSAELTDKEWAWSGDTIVTCDGCYKDSICRRCRLHENLISRLKYKLFQQRKITMGLQNRISSFEEGTEGLEEDMYTWSTDDGEEDTPLYNLMLKKRKKSTEQVDKADIELKKRKMSTETEQKSTDTASGKEIQEYVIDKEKALKKLGEIPLIDMKIKEEQRNKNKTKVIIFRRKTFVELLPDCLLSDLRRQRKERSAIVGTLVEIVTENRKKLVKPEDKRYLEDLDFLKVNFESLGNRCQQCGSQCFDIMLCVCIACKRIFCEACMVEHTKGFPNHIYEFSDIIPRKLIYQTTIPIVNEETSSMPVGIMEVIDMKCVKGNVVIITSLWYNDWLRVYSTMKGNQKDSNIQLKIELDKHNSQIAIIDENSVAITVPCKDYIHIVNFKANRIRKINVITNMTGAIAFRDSNLYVGRIENILTMNLQGENRVSVSLPNIQFLHPVGQNKLYCVCRKTISYLDMTNMEEHKLSEFPFHPVCLTSDDCGNIYFISNGVVWKAAHDGTDYKIVLTKSYISPTSICSDISNNLLLVLYSDGNLRIYRKV